MALNEKEAQKLRELQSRKEKSQEDVKPGEIIYFSLTAYEEALLKHLLSKQ